MGDNLLVAKFPKNSTEEVRFQVISYKGYDLIDMRVWVCLDNTGERVPTRKGLTLSVELLPELKKAVLALEEALKGAGCAPCMPETPGPR